LSVPPMQVDDAASVEAEAAEAHALAAAEKAMLGLSETEREERAEAQYALQCVLCDADARARVLMNPNLLPTAAIAGKWVCAYENVGLACPTRREPEHFLRHVHRTCAYCYVDGHTLPYCPLATRDGIPAQVHHFVEQI
jgi:hypothetical protein